MPKEKTGHNFSDKAKHIGVILLLCFFLFFLLQNMQQVEVSFLFWTISTPRAFLLLTTISIGAIAGYILAQIRHNKLTR